MAITQSNISAILTAAQGSSGVAKASATITLANDEPIEDDVIVVNGVTFTFKDDPSGYYEIDVKTTIDAQVTEIVSVLNTAAALEAQEGVLDLVTYTADLDNDQVDIEYKVAGPVGNAFTLEATLDTAANISIVGAATVSGDGTSTTLDGGAATGGTKYLSEADSGEIKEGRLDDTFEANVVAIIAAVEFVLANSQDPSADVSVARRQRKVLKEVLNRMAAAIKPAADSASSDLSSISARVANDAIARYDYKPREDDL
jgi:hypothetical protein